MSIDHSISFRNYFDVFQEEGSYNTLQDGYVPVVREMQGIHSLVQCVSEIVFGAESLPTNGRMMPAGYARLKDGVVNLSCSPLSVTALFLTIYFIC